MPIGVDVLIAQLDDLLQKYEELPEQYGEWIGSYRHDPTLQIRMQAALDRLSPPNSTYANGWSKSERTDGIASAVKALRDDYANGYLATVIEIIHSELFSDMLQAASHLLEEGYKDPAAVMTGGVLEQHLRELCTKSGVPIDEANGRPKKASQLNQDLRAGAVYNKQELQEVTAWLNLRNDAAHAQYDNYTAEQVRLMLEGVRHFMMRFPA